MAEGDASLELRRLFNESSCSYIKEEEEVL
jgi:hypothetical protein